MRPKTQFCVLTDKRRWLLTSWQPLGVCCLVKRCSTVWVTMPAVVTASKYTVEYANSWLFNAVVCTSHIFCKRSRDDWFFDYFKCIVNCILTSVIGSFVNYFEEKGAQNGRSVASVGVICQTVAQWG